MSVRLAFFLSGLVAAASLAGCNARHDGAAGSATAAGAPASPNEERSASAMPGVIPHTYTGNAGKKDDPGTACSTARTKPDGSLDCGMSGKPITPTHVK